MNKTRRRFGLTLMVNHACNLRCSYCYTGAKFSYPMPAKIAKAAIDRGLASLCPGGQLDLSFFGGEPLLESNRILEWMAYTRDRGSATEKQARFNLTTNGTVTEDNAWQVMMANDLDLAVSFDGRPDVHDRYRRDVHDHKTSVTVEATLRRLLESGKVVRVNTVVRPDTLDRLTDGLVYLYGLGIRHVDLSVDLWSTWTMGDGRRLEKAVKRAAELWRDWLPEFALNWFDAKAGDLARLPITHQDTRCGFGEGEIAVAPSGRLYPCERLIGEDRPESPLRLPGHALNGEDFLGFSVAPFARCSACSRCLLNSSCDTICRCSNFVRTGDVNRPDGLLCILNKATASAAANVLRRNPPILYLNESVQTRALL